MAAQEWKFFKDETPKAGSFVEVANFYENNPFPELLTYTGITEDKIVEFCEDRRNMWRERISIGEKDPYGIPNVNFSLIEPDDERWEEFKKERLDHGFDESETWNLDATIVKFTLPRLKEFRECHNGYPAIYTEESWNEMIDKMIFWLENFDVIPTADKDKAAKLAEGKQLFFDNFENLWW